MDPLEEFANWLVFQVLGISAEGALGGALAFFIYDSIKVFLLLVVLIFLVSILRTFITPARIKKTLGGKKEGVGNILAALLGIPTPFCSCSAIPMFLAFMEAGVPLGVTFSFLIASPMINEVAAAMLLGLFGWEIAALYIGTGFVIAVLAGFLIGKLKLEKEVEDFAYKTKGKKYADKKMNWKQRIEFAKIQTLDLTSKLIPYVLVGIAVGAFIHGFIPMNALSEIAGKDNPFAVPIAVAIGVPIYSNAAGTIPIIQSLMEKGMATGTALALMMSITALSLPEMIILRRILKPKLLAVFVGILTISFILVGLLFNAILG
jgi:uncharacterized membrane protein YraQ (UPF0718 family)